MVWVHRRWLVRGDGAACASGEFACQISRLLRTSCTEQPQAPEQRGLKIEWVPSPLFLPLSPADSLSRIARQARHLPSTSELWRKNSPAPLKSSQRDSRIFGGGTGDKPTWRLNVVAGTRRWARGDHEDGFQVLQFTGNGVLPGQSPVQPRRDPFVLARRKQSLCVQSCRVGHCTSVPSRYALTWHQ